MRPILFHYAVHSSYYYANTYIIYNQYTLLTTSNRSHPQEKFDIPVLGNVNQTLTKKIEAKHRRH